MRVGVKQVRWVGSSLDDLRRLPREVRRDIGFALDAAQNGEKHPSAKPLRGFNCAGVLGCWGARGCGGLFWRYFPSRLHS